MTPSPDVRKAAWILGAALLFEGYFVVRIAWPDPQYFLSAMGFIGTRHAPTIAGWITALFVTAAYIAISLRLPSVRANILRPSLLKLLALATAVATGILEEIAFRSALMNSLQTHHVGIALQVLLSGLAFGMVHGIWALMSGSWRAGLGAIVATGLLGTALAVVYIVSGRSLAPCVAAHVLLNAFIEPGLVLAGIRGEMGRGLRSPAPSS